MSRTCEASRPIFCRISIDGASHKAVALIELGRLAFGLCGELERLKVGPARTRNKAGGGTEWDSFPVGLLRRYDVSHVGGPQIY